MQQYRHTYRLFRPLCQGKVVAVWLAKCTRRKGFFGQENVQRRKEDYWKIAFQNQHEIRQNGRIKYSMNGKWAKDASLESCSFTLDMAKIRRFDTNIVNMSAESLNLWLAKFIQDVCKGNGQRYPGRTLYSMVCYLVLSNTVSSG